MAVNGSYYGDEDLIVNLPTGPAIDIVDVNYTTDRDVELVHGQGSAPRGFGCGQVKTSGDMTMRREQWNLFLMYCAAAGKSPLKIPAFNITLAWINEDQGMTTVQLGGVKLKGLGGGSKKGDKTSDVKVPFVYLTHEENGVDMLAGLNMI